ncbi:helix-turn-helix transcriptional regulator [Comamonadaceae bacterium G21597-S1]|nr:helix-turn-helix transcriptional regulator [Comamonadaceae bacterium G21597-S1]
MNPIADLINRLQAEPIKLTQSEISRRTGIPQPRISRWGAGDVAAGANDALKLVTLARELGINTEGAPATPEPTHQAA